MVTSPGVLLRGAGLRPTSQRLAVLDVISKSEKSLTAQDVYARLRRRAGAGLTTVYRTLAALADAGILDTFEQSGEKSFRLCASEHHHHIVCVSCGSVEEIEGAEVEDWVKRLARNHHFEVISHRADIYGRCRDCR